jgi:outer membrane protein OmpA-like peptidoglycan-associated protein
MILKHNNISVKLVLFYILLLPFRGSGQELLVNGGFEEENICSEYKVNCAPEAWIYTVPSYFYYFKDRELAHSGEHFVSIIAGHAKKPYYRTFVRSRLLCGLRKDHIYELRLFVKSLHPILDSIGVYFTSYDFLFEKEPYKKITPTLYLKDAIQRPSKSSSWQQISFLYKASGTESFISFGNFKRDDITGPTGLNRENNYFVLLDDISLRPVDPKEQLCSDWKNTMKEIYAQDERHEYLNREIKESKNKPLQRIHISITQLQKIDTLVLPDVLFATNSYTLTREANKVLDSFIISTKKLIIDSIQVHGHTDNRGTYTSNEILSQKRALSVLDYLQPHFNTNIQANGWGSSRPVADNNTPMGRQRNRRVEIYLYARE